MPVIRRVLKAGRLSRRFPLRGTGREPEFDPTRISSLTSWHDFFDGGSVFASNSGGSQAVSGGKIGRILDKSGNARHLSQATADNRPTWNANGYASFAGGAPSTVLLTSGINCSNFFSTTNNTLILVARYVGAPSLQIWGNPSSTGTMNITAVAGPKLRATWWNGTAGQSQIVTANNIAADTDYVIIVRRVHESSLQMSINGVPETPVTLPPASSALTNLATVLGITAPTSSNVGACRIYQHITYNTAISLDDCNRLGRWIRRRRGFSWTDLS